MSMRAFPEMLTQGRSTEIFFRLVCLRRCMAGDGKLVPVESPLKLQ
jgi:hypothetical protein